MPVCELKNLSDAHFERTGCTPIPSPLGQCALQFDNKGGDFATDYLKSDVQLPEGDFSVQFWLRTYASGCNGVPFTEGMLPKGDEVINPALRTNFQTFHGGVIMANCPCRMFHTGLSIQVNQPHSYLTVNFQTANMESAISLRGMRQACDDSWHLITVNVQRDGLLSVYCDDQLLKSADISAHAKQSLGDGTITVGADAMKLYALGKVDLAHFSLQHSVLSEEEIVAAYWPQAVQALCQEIYSRKLDESPLFEQAPVASLLEKVAKTLENLAAYADCKAVYDDLRAAYEETLLCTVKPDLKLLVVADTHCAEAENGRTIAFRNALQWAQKINVDAMLHGGDYSHFGRECDFKGFWDSMRMYFNNKPFFLTVGNHETLHNDAKTLAKRQCDWLREFNMVSEDHETMYYEGEVNGHHVLVLSQYYDYEITGYKAMWQFAGKIGQEQLDWVREKVNAYCGQGKPVFVIIHNSHGPLLEAQTRGGCMPHSKILRGDELYDILRDHSDIILCTGHVHHGLGAISGLFPIDGYHVLDIPGFRNATYGHGFDENVLPMGTSHTGLFAYVFGRTILLRAADFATKEWLTAYDQIVTLP